MDWPDLITQLANPAAFPCAPRTVEVRHTHISVVYMTDEFVYKVKKPVDFGFLNFLTLEDRLKYCEAEVKLNSRLAPGVYLGVVPITFGRDGPRFEGEGLPVEWAVKMRRLPDDATLAARLAKGELSDATFARLGQAIAQFHRNAPGGPSIERYGSFAVIAHNSRENYQQSRPHIGTTISKTVWSRLTAANDRQLERLSPLMESRAKNGMTRDVHGDLHLDHVYLFPDRAPPQDMLILDCVEFNDSYRCSDVVADMAFLAMDLIFHDQRDLMRSFVEAYFEKSGDGDGRKLLDFYVAYRAAVRGKVEGLLALAAEAPADKREAALKNARAHWLVALGALEAPARRPALVMTSGLPGSGKSRIANDLSQQAGFVRVVSDVVRKELAGLSPTSSAKTGFGEGIYTAEWNARTYGECLRRAEELLFEGARVVVDASFREESRRLEFMDLAARMGVPCILFHRTAPEEVVRERLSRRGPTSISDADWAISSESQKRWQAASKRVAGATVEIPHTAEKHEPLRLATEALRMAGLF